MASVGGLFRITNRYHFVHGRSRSANVTLSKLECSKQALA